MGAGGGESESLTRGAGGPAGGGESLTRVRGAEDDLFFSTD